MNFDGLRSLMHVNNGRRSLTREERSAMSRGDFITKSNDDCNNDREYFVELTASFVIKAKSADEAVEKARAEVKYPTKLLYVLLRAKNES